MQILVQTADELKNDKILASYGIKGDLLMLCLLTSTPSGRALTNRHSKAETSDGNGGLYEGGIEDAGNSAPVRLLHLEREDYGAIERLEAQGFSKQAAANAYFECGKNEDYALNYLYRNAL
ncbi:hypothetical protein BJ165DRAFT_1598577 [Panaeolus papilionaceus]|nr:hypothetical protein BJ165DRAFT_1598577 [Panaeolus papilionaceus]